MAISKDLFLAILAMDSYNRGYGAGLSDGGNDDPEGLGEVGRVGNARLLDPLSLGRDSNKLGQWQDAGFYALAYDIGADGPEGLAGKTVISYRGTDTSLDHSTGWSVGAGNIDDWTQAPLALEVYIAATGQCYRDGPASDVILTGHALGGGLAA